MEIARNVLLNWILPLLAVVALLFAMQWLRRPEVQVGENGEAPGFVLSDSEGVQVSLAEFRGRPVVVNFWGTWCGPCKAELPILGRFARKHPEVVVLGLAVESGGPEELAEAREQLGIEFRVLEATPRVKQDWGVSVVPTTFLVDGGGVLRKSHVGVISPMRLASWVD